MLQRQDLAHWKHSDYQSRWVARLGRAWIGLAIIASVACRTDSSTGLADQRHDPLVSLSKIDGRPLDARRLHLARQFAEGCAFTLPGSDGDHSVLVPTVLLPFDFDRAGSRSDTLHVRRGKLVHAVVRVAGVSATMRQIAWLREG